MPTPGERSAAAFRSAEAWRHHPSLRYSLRHVVPGFGLGAAAFLAYCAAEQVYLAASRPKKGAAGAAHH